MESNEDHIPNHLPSYINLSCAVSGYRPINKYGAPSSEGCHLPVVSDCTFFAEGASLTDQSITPISNMNEICGTMPHSEDLFRRQMRKWEFWDAAAYGEAAQNSSYSQQAKSDVNSPNKSSQHSYKQLVRVDNIPDAQLKVGFLYDKNTTRESHSNEPTANQKSFIEQRIERLYGPSALGVGFRTRRALMELQNEKERQDLEGSDINGQTQEGASSGLPSVFKHLRPEFRYQLPIKPKIGIQFDAETKRFHQKAHTDSDTGQFVKKIASLDINYRQENNERGRNIPIQLENGISSEACAKPISNGTSFEVETNRTISVSPTKDSNSHSKQKFTQRVDQTTDVNSNSDSCGAQQGLKSQSQEEGKGGHFFLKVVDVERSLLLNEVSHIERDLASHSELMSEEVKGKLFSTIGKVNLLISQKLKQFIGLCHKNINRSPSEEFPTTDEDLAGFWDMVVIQVDSLKGSIEEIKKIRSNNWKEVALESKPSTVRSKTKMAAKKGGKPTTSSKNPKDEARKKASEERRKAMREAMNAKRKEANLKAKDEQVEIFIAEK